jgi:serine/threonine-protein kinase
MGEATLSDADRTGFGFDRPDAELIDRLREAERMPALGRVGGYELVAVAGIGGQGVVYRARQIATGREVALKRILAGSWAGEAARSRFAREIQADAVLHHPNIVTVYGVEEIDGQPLLAMEWIDGVAIDRWAEARDEGTVLGTFLKVCAGIQHAHQRGVIHRDLKPSNILVDAAGEPRVLDFGLAKVTTSRSRLTVSGGFLGTLAYSAPEQVRGDADGADVRTDVYAHRLSPPTEMSRP